jgi:hypothetical protein
MPVCRPYVYRVQLRADRYGDRLTERDSFHDRRSLGRFLSGCSRHCSSGCRFPNRGSRLHCGGIRFFNRDSRLHCGGIRFFNRSGRLRSGR